MAISNTEYELYNKESKGYLEISATEFYFNKVRPFITDMQLKCKTDRELLRTLDKVLNSADGFCQRKQYDLMSESFDVLNAVITSPNYFNGIMMKAPEEEKKMVRDLAVLISDMKMIIKCEPEVEKEEKKPQERLGYLSPIGENEDYDKHNMKILTQPSPKKRIPNI